MNLKLKSSIHSKSRFKCELKIKITRTLKINHAIKSITCTQNIKNHSCTYNITNQSCTQNIKNQSHTKNQSSSNLKTCNKNQNQT